MKKVILLIQHGFLLFVFSLVACESGPRGNVAGDVRSTFFNSVVCDAVLRNDSTTLSAELHTPELGFWLLEDVPVGEYEVVMECSGLSLVQTEGPCMVTVEADKTALIAGARNWCGNQSTVVWKVEADELESVFK